MRRHELSEDEAAFKNAIAPFRRPGERFHSNFSLTQPERALVRTPQDYVTSLLQSDMFQTVRIDEDAAFDDHGRPYQGAVAVFVTPKPAPQG